MGKNSISELSTAASLVHLGLFTTFSRIRSQYFQTSVALPRMAGVSWWCPGAFVPLSVCHRKGETPRTRSPLGAAWRACGSECPALCWWRSEALQRLPCRRGPLLALVPWTRPSKVAALLTSPSGSVPILSSGDTHPDPPHHPANPFLQSAPELQICGVQPK